MQFGIHFLIQTFVFFIENFLKSVMHYFDKVTRFALNKSYIIAFLIESTILVFGI